MKRLLAVWMVLCFFSGCAANKAGADPSLTLRNELQKGSECSFRCTVTADYGDSITAFTMDCVSSGNGDMTITLVEPETICGIQGIISQESGALTFEDKVLLVQLLADGQITPICSPWLMVRTLLGGIVRATECSANGSQVIYDDVFSSEPFQMYAQLNGDHIPVICEFVWQGRRIITVQVDNFKIL